MISGVQENGNGMAPSDTAGQNALPKDDSQSGGKSRNTAEPILVDQGEEAPSPQVAGADIPGPSAAILVVDDAPDNLDLASRWLLNAGYRVLTACSGILAMTMMRTDHPDLVLLDVMMPDMDGYQVCALMQKDPILSQIPVIFLTAHNDPREIVRGLQIGATDYLSKPYFGEEMLARVASALRSKQERDLLVERTKELTEQSVRDPLTGLYNRRLLNERLTQEVARADRYGLVLSCLMVDIDFFKSVNDTLGHAVGDELIRSVAQVIDRCARVADFVARYGGEEFAVILPQTGSREAYEVAERIRRQVTEITVRELAPRTLSVSIGVASFPGPGVLDMHSLISMADHAMLRAKATGKNRTVVANSEDSGMVETEGVTVPNLRILIVEDEPNNQALLQKVLSRMGYDWECIVDGAEAVSRVAVEPFALVLMDLSLPEMDGWEAIRLIRASGNTVPIVATSAHAMQVDKDRAAEAGCNDYVTKPFNLPELRRLLGTYVPLPPVG